MYAIGVMPMPANFRYRDVFLKGKPRHDRYDSFRIRHPEMPPAKRAKLFAPFDALRGFDFVILMKNEVYTDRVIMSPERPGRCLKRRENTSFRKLLKNRAG